MNKMTYFEKERDEKKGGRESKWQSEERLSVIIHYRGQERRTPIIKE